MDQQTQVNNQLLSMGDVAKKLHVKRSVVRIWSKAFGIKALKVENGEKFFAAQDLDAFAKIKQSFADKKNMEGDSFNEMVMPAISEQLPQTENQVLSPELLQQLKDIKQQLIQLKTLLS